MLFTISIYGNAAVCDFFSLIFTFAYYIVILYSYKDSIIRSPIVILYHFHTLFYHLNPTSKTSRLSH